MAKAVHTGMIIGASAIEWYSLVKEGEHIAPAGSGRVEMDAEIKAFLAGGGEAPKEALARLRKELAGVGGDVSLGLSLGQVLLRVLTLPPSEPDEIKNMVDLQVDKISPFPVESLVVSHEALGRRGNSNFVAAVAVKQDIIGATRKFLDELGIVPVRVDLCSFAWWKGIGSSGALSGKGREAVLLMAEAQPGLIIFQDGLPVLFRSLGNSEDAGGEKVAGELAEEINYSLMSLELEHGAAPLSRLVVVREQQGQDALLEKLRAACDCEIIARTVSSLPSPAEGLARRLAGGEGLDLTPEATKHERVTQEFWKKIKIGSAAALGVWLAFVLVIACGMAWERHRIAGIEAEKTRYSKQIKEVKDMRDRVNTIMRYMDRRHSALECLREIIILQPDGVDLASFSYRKGESLKISGDAAGVNMVYDFKKQLDASKLFSGCSLQGPKRAKDRETFEIECKLPEIAE